MVLASIFFSGDLENTMIDLSYTFGDEYTLTLGNSAVYSGKFIGTTNSDGQKYNSTDVFGYGHFSIFGVEYGIFEILLGYQFMKYAYLKLKSSTVKSIVNSINLCMSKLVDVYKKIQPNIKAKKISI